MNGFKKFIWIALLCVGLIVMLVSSAMATADFNFRERTMAWLVENISATVGLILMTFGAIYWIIDEFKRTDQLYLMNLNIVNKFATKQYRPTIWTKFAKLKNKERKKNQFEEVLRHELHFLEAKASDKDLLLWDEGLCERNKHSFETSTYCQKRTLIEHRSDAKWIEENIDKIKVNYDSIDINIIISGHFVKKKNKIQQVNDFVTKGKTSKLVLGRIPMILFGSGFIAVVTSLIIGFEFSMNTFNNIAIKILSIIWNVYISIRFAEDWNKTVTLTDIMFQAGIVQEYNAYVKHELIAKGLWKEEDNDDSGNGSQNPSA